MLVWLCRLRVTWTGQPLAAAQPSPAQRRLAVTQSPWKPSPSPPVADGPPSPPRTKVLWDKRPREGGQPLDSGCRHVLCNTYIVGRSLDVGLFARLQLLVCWGLDDGMRGLPCTWHTVVGAHLGDTCPRPLCFLRVAFPPSQSMHAEVLLGVLAGETPAHGGDPIFVDPIDVLQCTMYAVRCVVMYPHSSPLLSCCLRIRTSRSQRAH